LDANPIESSWWLPNRDHQLFTSSSIGPSKKTKGATQMDDSQCRGIFKLRLQYQFQSIQR
jgi:hypothetical protein